MSSQNPNTVSLNTVSPKAGSKPVDSDPWRSRTTAGVTFASALRFENIKYAYRDNQVLNDVTLTVEPGEILCLLGPSGSGKTTLLRLAAGLETPSGGSVHIDDRIMDDAKTHILPEHRGVGLVFQDFALFPHLTVLQNVMFGLTEISRADAKIHALRTLERVGMAHYAKVYPHEISGGEQQRVALARALAPRPRVLLMDEPFSGLDARLRDSIRDQTVELLHETRSTTIIVTHDPEEALRLGDHIALMHNGNIVQYGTGDDLFYNPVNRFAAEFFSELNVYTGEVTNGLVSTPIGEIAASSLSDGQIIEVCIRLSDIQVADIDDPKALGVVASINSRRFAGMVELLDLEISGQLEPVRLRIKAGLLPKEARQLKIHIEPKKIMVFSVE